MQVTQRDCHVSLCETRNDATKKTPSHKKAPPNDSAFLTIFSVAINAWQAYIAYLQRNTPY